MAWTNLVDYQVGQATCVTKFDEQILSNIDFSGSHGHTGNPGDGANILYGGSTLQGTSHNESVSQYISLVPAMPTGQNSIIGTFGANQVNGHGRQFQDNDTSASYGLGMSAGTWSFSFIFSRASGRAIISACIDGASVGQVDTSGTTAFVVSAASTISIATPGQKTLTVGVTPSGSSGIAAVINHIELRRLSA